MFALYFQILLAPGIATRNPASLLVARTLLGAPGLTSNKKLLSNQSAKNLIPTWHAELSQVLWFILFFAFVGRPAVRLLLPPGPRKGVGLKSESGLRSYTRCPNLLLVPSCTFELAEDLRIL